MLSTGVCEELLKKCPVLTVSKKLDLKPMYLLCIHSVLKISHLQSLRLLIMSLLSSVMLLLLSCGDMTLFKLNSMAFRLIKECSAQSTRRIFVGG